MSSRSRLVLSRASFAGVLLAALPSGAASLQKVDQSTWGLSSLPSYVNMYIYVPDKLATKPPIVAAPHHCGGNGPGTFNEMSSLVQIANNAGFVMIFPEATGENCWDAGSMRSLKHDGGGDTQAIVQMVKYALSKYGGDPDRVYSVGSSSGGIMTEALLGVYPDVFMAGVSLMGVPCGCWGQSYNDVTGNGNSAQWSGPCAGGTVTKTGQQWGDLVRSYFPGYTGHRPRLQHWHGTADTTLSYKNLAEDVKEWTNLLALPDMPTGMDTPKNGTTHQFWKNSCGYVVYETFSLSGVGHSVPFDGNAVAAYFGIDKSGGQDPETAACPGAVPGGSGTSGAGGTSSSGGASGSAGASNSGGANAAGGTTGGAGHIGVAGAGGASAGSGGAVVGIAGTSTGAAGSGAVGAPGAGGVISANGGTGGVTASSGSGGSNLMGAGGGSDGIAAAAGGAASGDSSSGCDCAVGSDRRDSGVAASSLLLAALGWLRRRPKRRLR